MGGDLDTFFLTKAAFLMVQGKWFKDIGGGGRGEGQSTKILNFISFNIF